MSADGSLTLKWADGEYKFRLAIGQMRELQESVNKPRVLYGAPPVGPRDMLLLLETGNMWPHDVRELVRLALIGGGTKPLDALTLVKRYVEDRPLFESAPLAYSILEAACVGAPDDPVGKPPAGETTPTDPPTGGSVSPASMVSGLH